MMKKQEIAEKTIDRNFSNASPMGGSTGSVFGVSEMGSDDLRERNRAVLNILEDVAESEHNLRRKTVELEKFRQAADESFDHVIITDAEGVILYANNAVTEITGYSQQEIIGHSSSLWGGMMLKSFYERMWNTIKIEKKRFSGEINNKRKNGENYLASIRISPILGSNGTVRFFVGVERDITEEREAQIRVALHAKELQEANKIIEKQKERSESILHFLKSIGDGVVATDLSGKIIFFNEAAEKLTGLENNEAMEKNAIDALALYGEKDRESRYDIIGLTLGGKNKAHVQNEHYFIRNKDGVDMAISFSASLIYDTQKEKQGCIIVMRDETEQRELEKTKDNFLSVAAHQLRTPLSGIRWSLEMLLDGDAGQLSPQADEIVRKINENTQRLVLLVNDLLDVSRINMGKTKEEAVPINICKMLHEATEGLQGLISERGVNVSFEDACSLNPTVKSAPKHLFQAIENLLSNAVKYTPKGGNVNVITDFKDNEVIIKVTDDGIGIPKRDQEKIFSKFFRASNAVLKETEGSGLGLNVVKSFVEEAGGRIWFESEEGKGTTFYIALPNYKEK